jgi:hypothetical protein
LKQQCNFLQELFSGKIDFKILKLLSGSKDGKILSWNALPSKNQLKLIDGFIMLIDYLPRSHHKAIGTEMGGSYLCLFYPCLV